MSYVTNPIFLYSHTYLFTIIWLKLALGIHVNFSLAFCGQVLRLLEDVGLPELVIHMATLAITEVGTDVRSEVGIWMHFILSVIKYVSFL